MLCMASLSIEDFFSPSKQEEYREAIFIQSNCISTTQEGCGMSNLVYSWKIATQYTPNLKVVIF